jgi:hypothetical protein
MSKNISISIPESLFDRLEDKMKYHNFDISRICSEAIESEVNTIIINTEVVEDSAVEFRKNQFREINSKQLFDKGRYNGSKDVTGFSALHVRDILLIDQINTTQRDEEIYWFAKLPESLTDKGSGFVEHLDSLLLEHNVCFDGNAYIHGYIIGVKEGWTVMFGEIMESSGPLYFTDRSDDQSKVKPVVPNES